jgi:DNA-binding NarL/FixJ family response regulator
MDYREHREERFDRAYTEGVPDPGAHAEALAATSSELEGAIRRAVASGLTTGRIGNVTLLSEGTVRTLMTDWGIEDD